MRAWILRIIEWGYSITNQGDNASFSHTTYVLIAFMTSCYITALYGEMAERFKAAVLKTVVGLRPPGVRIPLSPPSSFPLYIIAFSTIR